MPHYSRRDVLRASGGLLGGLAVGSTVTAAAAAGRFLVDTTGLSTGTLERSGLAVVHDLDAIRVAVVEGSEEAVHDLGVDYGVDTRYSLDLPAEHVRLDGADAVDEPGYPLQWDKQAQDVPAAHEVTRGEGARVAVVDSGVAAGHPDLQHAVNLALSKNFTGDGLGVGGPYGGYHGTHVAGIVAADDRNDAGVVGTAPGAEIVDCRVFGRGPYASFGDVVAAMVYSAEISCDATNMSLGAYPVPRPGLGEFYGRVLNRTTTYASRQGTLLVAAAGNDGADLQHDGSVVSLPNEAANVVSVSATGPIGFGWGEPGLREGFDSPAFYTNYGTNAIDVGAPGGDADLDAIGTGVAWYLDLVFNAVALPDFEDGEYRGAKHGYGWAAGTSMAAPQVAGAAALVTSVEPSFGPNQVRQRLENTAAVPDGYEKTYYGSGFLNPNAAVRR